MALTDIIFPTNFEINQNRGDVGVITDITSFEPLRTQIPSSSGGIAIKVFNGLYLQIADKNGLPVNSPIIVVG